MDKLNNDTLDNLSEFKIVNSTDEIIKKFDEFVKDNKISLSKEKIFDFIARISYFYNNSFDNRPTPYFNNSIGKEQYNGCPVSHRSLFTVPKTVNNYYEFGKGNLIPFCKFSGYDKKHGARNDFYVYVDIENDIVYTSIAIVREITGKSGKVFAEADFSIENFCIPSVTSVIRGTISDIMQSSKDVMRFNEQYSDFNEYNNVLKKCVIMVSRIDTDCRHPNKFIDLPRANKEILKLAKEIFKEKADAPHFHFCCKDYILNHKETDSSAIAIGLNQIPDYLITLKTADKTDVVLKENFGMPFLEIRNRQAFYNYDMILNLTRGIKQAYKSFTKVEKEDLIRNFEMQINFQANKIARAQGETKAREYINNCKDVFNIIAGIEEKLKSKDYINVDALTLLCVETEFLKIISSCSNIRSKLSNKSNSAYNDFFLTINESLGKKKYLHKKKPIDYYGKYAFNYESTGDSLEKQI